MQPIHYSFVFNILALIVFALLSWFFKEPLLIVIALLLSQHNFARFGKGQHDDDDDDDDPSIGFTANVS